MTTQEIADRLVKLCRETKNLQAIDELYGDNIVSVEMVDHPGMPKEMIGKAAIRAKNEWFFNAHDIHKVEISDPLVTEAHFAVKMRMDLTEKQTGKSHGMGELAVYEVKGGKIVREQFFYGTP